MKAITALFFSATMISTCYAADWVVDEQSDKIDRALVRVGSLEADEASRVGGFGETTALLILRCARTKGEIFISTNQFLGLSLKPIDATLRLGEDVKSIKVSVSQSAKGIFFRPDEGKKILSALETNKEIALRISGPVTSVDAIFKASSGSAPAIAVMSTCKL